jgi:hypothetical protein
MWGLPVPNLRIPRCSYGFHDAGDVVAPAVGYAVISAGSLLAQPQPGSSPPPVDAAEDGIFPRVRLTYYPGPEGGKWKQVDVFDLKEWTIEKNVYLEYGWTDPPPKINERPLLPNGQRDYSLPELPKRIWRIRYEPAATEGQSRLFITGIGGRNGRVRIYGDSDVISLIYIADTGWHELGPEARLARFLQQRRLNAVTPTPTRSQ